MTNNVVQVVTGTETQNVVQVLTTETPNRVLITTTRTPGVQQFTYQVQIFTVPGTLSTGSGRAKFYIPGAITLGNVRASVGTAPTGQDLIIDVNKNGTTVFTNQALRPKIYAGQTLVSTSTPAVTQFSTGDYITVDVDQVGTFNPGSDLTVQIEFTP
jgi:hypothetical protein